MTPSRLIAELAVLRIGRNWRYRPATDRFIEKFDENGPIPVNRPELGRCWQWNACKTKEGYGSFNLGKRKTILAHHFAFYPLPGELEADHLCRNRACVRPSHLRIVPHSDNGPALRMFCKRGHLLIKENLLETRQGNRIGRRCRTCALALSREAKRDARSIARRSRVVN